MESSKDRELLLLLIVQSLGVHGRLKAWVPERFPKRRAKRRSRNNKRGLRYYDNSLVARLQLRVHQ